MEYENNVKIWFKKFKISITLNIVKIKSLI